MYSPQSQSPSQYSSPLFMQQLYGPQQQYPVYGIVPPAWAPSPTPYFETPLVRLSSLFLSQDFRRGALSCVNALCCLEVRVNACVLSWVLIWPPLSRQALQSHILTTCCISRSIFCALMCFRGGGSIRT